MRVAVGSDERTPLTHAVIEDLQSRGHDLAAHLGPLLVFVASGVCQTAVLFCWTGTGASIAANKVPGVRAALCTDAATAAGSRTWNDANVVVMGLRLTSPELAREMLDAWFSTEPDPDEAANIARLEAPPRADPERAPAPKPG